MISPDLLPAFRQSLLSGSYNLLTGSGISRDSKNGRGDQLLGAEDLRAALCSLTGAKSSTSLSRVYPLLSPAQISTELVEHYENCRPGPSLAFLDKFLWRRHFTFNVDDVLESLYGTASLQELTPINYDAPFEPTPTRSQLQVIHLHGWVRRPAAGFVFSNNEYARNMGAMNPWMHTLSEILATEPFIIAGTSLNEIDLEYYLSHRTSFTARRGSGPSLLIEPDPDSVTVSDCARYGLTLVKATFGEFLSWLHATFPAPPTVADLVIPNTAAIFAAAVTPRSLLTLFNDFELVLGSDIPLPANPSPFMSGREPDWDDMHHHYDIERTANDRIRALIDSSLKNDADPKLFLFAADAGTGKSTTLRRIGHDFAINGQPVFSVKALSRINVDEATTCFSGLNLPVLLLVDNFADHAEQIRELMDRLPKPSRLIVLGSERSYRNDYVRLAVGKTPHMRTSFSPLTVSECEQLLGRYQSFGLIADPAALNNPTGYARLIAGEPIAISVCQILNDFKSVDVIVNSLIKAATPENRSTYLRVALAQHCYSEGVRYSILQATLGPKISIAPFFGRQSPLQLAANVNESDFVTTLQAVLGERMLKLSSVNDGDEMLSAFTTLATALGPYVNRRAIITRSPEARLARRLFDADKVVKPFLQGHASTFYTNTQTTWEWNSRYWEQRALFTADLDLVLALQYARHAVAIERHPFALTTLSKLLFMQMEIEPNLRDAAFHEGFDRLQSAIRSEADSARVTLHPFLTLFTGTSRYIDLGGTILNSELSSIRAYLLEAPTRFRGDPMIENARMRLDEQLHGYR